MNCPECGSEVEDGFCKECELDRELQQRHDWGFHPAEEACLLCDEETEEVPV